MMSRQSLGLRLASTIFGIVAAAHLLRLATRAELVIAGWDPSVRGGAGRRRRAPPRRSRRRERPASAAAHRRAAKDGGAGPGGTLAAPHDRARSTHGTRVAPPP